MICRLGIEIGRQVHFLKLRICVRVGGSDNVVHRVMAQDGQGGAGLFFVHQTALVPQTRDQGQRVEMAGAIGRVAAT